MQSQGSRIRRPGPEAKPDCVARRAVQGAVIGDGSWKRQRVPADPAAMVWVPASTKRRQPLRSHVNLSMALRQDRWHVKVPPQRSIMPRYSAV